MSNLVQLLPNSEYYQSYREYERYGEICSNGDGLKAMTPYEDRATAERTIVEHKIAVPFGHIVQRDEGFSVCTHCKARYVGFQQQCNRKVPYFRLDNGYSRWSRGDAGVNDVFKQTEYGFPSKVVESRMLSCGSHTVWDLQTQWDLQHRFFEFVALIGSVSLEQIKSMKEFEGSLPAGTIDLYRTAILTNKAESLNAQMSMMVSNLRMIAEKMNTAGHNLIF